MLSEEKLLECLDAVKSSEKCQNCIGDCRKCEYSISLDTLEEAISEYFNPQPYEFEDLKEGMWIWDEEFHECFLVAKIYNRNKIIRLNLGSYWWEMDFKENRFYPVTKALQYQGD